MKIMRAARVFVPLLALLGSVTCGSSGTSTSGTGGVGGKADSAGGKGGGAKSGGGTNGSGGITGNGGTSGGPRRCPSSSTSSCTAAETNAYSMCVGTACDAQYKTCLGADYRNGNYSGVCATSFQCQEQCACGDTACLTKCASPSAECLTCLLTLVSCSSTCTEPACYTTGQGGISGGFGGISGLGGIFGGFGGFFGGLGGASGTACADLLACCNRAAATVKPSCLAAYTSAMSTGDTACALGLAGIQAIACP